MFHKNIRFWQSCLHSRSCDSVFRPGRAAPHPARMQPPPRNQNQIALQPRQKSDLVDIKLQ